MTTSVAKKTFSIKKDIVTQLDQYNNKSRFVNEALSFYIDYLDSFKTHKDNFLEKKITEALEWEFYKIELSNSGNKNDINYINHSEKLEKELLSAINEK